MSTAEDSTDTYALNMDDNHIFQKQKESTEITALSSCISNRPLTANSKNSTSRKAPTGTYQRIVNQLYRQRNKKNGIFPYTYLQAER